jgi:hypothetical protein
MRWIGGLLLIPAALMLAGCGFGRVEQGRVVEYDRGQGLVTMILDSNPGAHRTPRYDRLPPQTVRVPANPAEMGPAPRAGLLLAVDRARHQIVAYDAASRALRTVSYTPVEEQRNVGPGSLPLPAIDREKGTITLYEPLQRLRLTFSAGAAELSLPEDTWKPGDEVRYYFKQPGQALRMMNVTQTDLSKAGE